MLQRLYGKLFCAAHRKGVVSDSTIFAGVRFTGDIVVLKVNSKRIPSSKEYQTCVNQQAQVTEECPSIELDELSLEILEVVILVTK